jgi:hypothetical protein
VPESHLLKTRKSRQKERERKRLFFGANVARLSVFLPHPFPLLAGLSNLPAAVGAFQLSDCHPPVVSGDRICSSSNPSLEHEREKNHEKINSKIKNVGRVD